MTRRLVLRGLVCAGVMLGIVAVPVLADELLGVLTKVDIEGKKVTIESKDGTETEVTINDATQYVTRKGAANIDLEKVTKSVERAQEKGRKGISVKVTHDNSVASKIEVAPRKKRTDAAKSD